MARSRRLRREARTGEHLQHRNGKVTPAQDELRTAYADVSREVIKETLAPVVREHLTDELLGRIKSMVGLSEYAIEGLRQDLSHESDRVRQKAIELILKYTLGNDSVRPQPESPTTAPMTVNFALPRPESTSAPTPEIEVEAVEVEQTQDTRPCDMCEQLKPDSEFMEGSDRCRECFANQQQIAQDILNEG